ncbi:MFS general substrate transporter [Fomitiporia mediterranea MF3/22]|uniref:MFS general substrate transporter n=1 Tax=Fomitiporia mediterranea (strain MF3/22) TaxID=694068 RepID=UPI0004409CAB|nr:MFS general substrate transporter [Fomitiporia mediterranea MF3/22]EJC99279.1 MFS general substrate transporter [Fomitiporia mediterranea MF3/22]
MEKTAVSLRDDPSRSGSFTDEKANASDAELIHGTYKSLDVGLRLVSGHTDEPEVSPAESKRLRRKIDWRLLPMLCIIYTVQFVDKSTLASTSILGLLTDNDLSTDEFNTLSSAFYIGYLVFSWPQNWALQKLPVGRWLTFNIFLWSLFLGLHAVCHNFGGLFALRFLLGASEGSMTAGLMLVCGMFYTRREIGERIGWIFQCNGFAVIVSSFLQFAMVHTSPHQKPNQWQWLMITTALMTFVPFLAFLLFFPDNPTTARFLTAEEKLAAVRRVQANQNGIETKAWKSYQMWEALKDPKTWLFGFFAAFANLIGGIGVQYSLLIKSFGFSTLETSLLSIPNGVAQIIGITAACFALRMFPNSRCWIGIIGWIPSIVSCLIEITAPTTNRVARLVGVYLMFLGSSPAYVMAMSWVTSAVSGHTKKTVVRAVFLVGGSLGQILCTQFWKDRFKPSYHVPFGIILMSHLMSIILALALRFTLVRENNRREALKRESERTGVGRERFEEWAIVEVEKDGKVIKERVDKNYLDLTDGENLAFRYVL